MFLQLYRQKYAEAQMKAHWCNEGEEQYAPGEVGI